MFKPHTFDRMKNSLIKIGLMALMLVMAFPLSSQELRDPTRPGGFAVMDITDTSDISDGVTMQLQAIFFHPTKSAALINGRRFIEGDQLGQMKIQKIYADRVVLSDSTSETELKMPIPAVITRPDQHIGSGSPDSKE